MFSHKRFSRWFTDLNRAFRNAFSQVSFPGIVRAVYIYLINKLILFTQHYDSLVCHNYWHWGLFHIEKVWCYYRPQTKLREGNVFTGVCDSVHRGGRCLVPGGVWSRGVPGPGGSGPGGCLVETPPRTATAAGGTHPTGMHSCEET